MLTDVFRSIKFNTFIDQHEVELVRPFQVAEVTVGIQGYWAPEIPYHRARFVWLSY